MIYRKMVGIVLSVLVLIAFGHAQINNNSGSLEEYLKNLSLNQASHEIESNAPAIIKNVSQDILRINSSDIEDIANRSLGIINNVSICGIDLSEASDSNLLPDITLADVHTNDYYDMFGHHSDCTFTLNNTGDGDGVAVVNFERDEGILAKKTSFLSPKNAARKFNEKLDLPLLSFGQVKITCYIESQRKAKAEDCLDPYVRKN